MISYNESTIFNTNAQTLVNTINCNGVMGAGLALEFKLRYPQMYSSYVESCRQREIQVGHVYFYQYNTTHLIVNFPTKKDWKYPSRLEWISEGLKDFVKQYKHWGVRSVAFPKLGCDRGGLDWKQVKPLMEKYLLPLEDLQVYICLDSEVSALGIEKQMVDLINTTQTWAISLKINPNILEKINTALPIKRFRDLLKLSGVGTETYQKVFKFLYTLSQEYSTINENVETPVLVLESHTTINENVEVEAQRILERIMDLEDARIFLVTLLNYLGLKAEQISGLTWGELIPEGQEKLIFSHPSISVIIEETILRELKLRQGKAKPNQLVVSQKNNKKQPLKVTTIEKWIDEGKQLVKEEKKLKQLELDLFESVTPETGILTKYTKFNV